MEENRQKLTAEQRSQAIDWVKKHSAPGHCPWCSKNTWRVGDYLVTPAVVSIDGTISIGGRTTHHPNILLICANCAYTAQFNAVVMGITASAKVEPPDDGATGT